MIEQTHPQDRLIVVGGHPGHRRNVTRLPSVASVITATALLAAAAVARRRQLRWGATDTEVMQTMTGDDLVSDPDLTSTRAITIQAGADDVWPWLVQLGQGRGGFYSYDTLENLVGCDIHSADTINPKWQALGVGDAVRLAPEIALTVAVAEAPRTLVLQGGVLPGAVTAPYDFTWTFDLTAVSPTTTRLVVRERYAYLTWWVGLVIEPVTVLSFLMSRRMLRGIRDRAEHGRSHQLTGESEPSA
ncbi:MAG: SRPBCC family protein [Actinoplanes sp.]